VFCNKDNKTLFWTHGKIFLGMGAPISACVRALLYEVSFSSLLAIKALNSLGP